MSRLIDADNFIRILREIQTDAEHFDNEQRRNDIGSIMALLDKQPTAFDTEKVVGQLEEMKSLSEDAVAYEKRHGSIEDRLRAESSFKELNRVIDIVKKGGVE